MNTKNTKIDFTIPNQLVKRQDGIIIITSGETNGNYFRGICIIANHVYYNVIAKYNARNRLWDIMGKKLLPELLPILAFKIYDHERY